MKLKFLPTYFIMLFSFTVFAQNGTASYATANEKFNFGIKAGINISNQNIDYDIPDFPLSISTSSLTSFHFGVFGEFIFSDNIGLQSEIMFSREGSKIDMDILKFNQTISYIKIPLLIKIRPFDSGLSFLAGPQFGFLVNDDIDLDVDDGELLENSFKSFELSVAFGIEYDITNRFSIGGRYNLGLTDVSDTNEASLKNNNLQFSLGYKLF